MFSITMYSLMVSFLQIPLTYSRIDRITFGLIRSLNLIGMPTLPELESGDRSLKCV